MTTTLKGALIVLAQLVGVAVLIFGGVLLGIWAMSRPAGAQEYRCHYIQRSRPVFDTWTGNVTTQYYSVRQCHRNYRYDLPEAGPRVYGYARRDEGWSGGGCREVRRAVGDQHLTVDGAKKAANDAWAATVRFHLGEKWMSLDNARRIAYTCSRSSIKEGGVTTLGQSLNRCEIEAVPCHPPRDKEDR